MYKSIIRARKTARKKGGPDDMPYAQGDEQTYAHVQTLLGNGRVQALCNDGVLRMGRICGSMRRTRRAVIERGDIVLCCFRDFGGDVVDVVHKYGIDEVRVLARNTVLNPVILRILSGDANAATGGAHDTAAVGGAGGDDEAFMFEVDEDVI